MPDNTPSRPMLLEDRRDPEAPVTRADLASVQHQLNEGHLRMTALERELQMNTSLTADIRALLEAGRAGMRVLGIIGTAAAWAGKIAAAIAAVYTAMQLFHHGGPTK